MPVLLDYVLDITANIYSLRGYSLLKTKPLGFLILPILFHEYMRVENKYAPFSLQIKTCDFTSYLFSIFQKVLSEQLRIAIQGLLGRAFLRRHV